MKTIEELLQEYKIRFRDTEKIKEEGYLFSKNCSLNDGMRELEIKENSIHNKNGKVYDRGKWATADLKEAPEKWVVEMDKGNKYFEDFKELYESKINMKFEFNLKYYTYDGKVIWSNGINYYKGYQLLTLNQWAEFFLNEPKVGDWGLYYDDAWCEGNRLLENIVEIGTIYNISPDGKYRVKAGAGCLTRSWKYFYKIDFNKSLQSQIDEFLRQTGK